MYQAFDMEAKFLSYTKTHPSASQSADICNYSQLGRRVGEGENCFPLTAINVFTAIQLVQR